MGGGGGLEGVSGGGGMGRVNDFSHVMICHIVLIIISSLVFPHS